MAKIIINYIFYVFVVCFLITCIFAVIWDRVSEYHKHIVENIYDIIIICIMISAVIIGIIMIPKLAA